MEDNINKGTLNAAQGGNDMLKRVLTGAFIVAAIVLAFVLRQVVGDRELGKKLFDIMFYAFSVFGTLEILKTVKDKLTFFEKTVVCVFTLGYIPVLAFLGVKSGAVMLGAAVVMIFADYVFSFSEKSNEGVGYSLMSLFYPTVFLTAAFYINHRYGLPILLLLFVVSPFSDSGALFVGVIFKGKKLCPAISPKKTISGAVGGLIGGLLGAMLVWAFMRGIVSKTVWAEISIYALAGVLGSVATQFGDLVEGAIKRKFGIKDFGKMLPGHGGMLDRIDGLMFNSFFLLVFFGIVRILL